MARITRLDMMLGLTALAEEPVGNYSSNVLPPARAPFGSTVTVDSALALPAAYRAVQVIAGMGSQISIDAVRGGTVLSPAPSLVTRPDPWRPLSSFLERTLVCLATDGNAFWLKTVSNGAVVALEVLDPNLVTIVWKDGIKSYRVQTRKGYREYTNADIQHVWGLEVAGHDRGLGPIAACRAALSGIINLREYADGWFGEHASDVPSGVLSSDQHLDPEEVTEYKRIWLNPVDATGKSIVNGPSVRVLGKGLTYSPILLKPEDAQWLEAQSFGVLDVARMFGMPGDYLLAAVEGSSLTYTTLLMVDTQFMRTTLFPSYLRKIEAALTDCLVRGQEARFRVGDFLRPDAKTRAEVDEIYLRNDVVSAQEIRDREGWTGAAPEPRQQTPTEAPA